jgi:glutaminyl-tRNA synthetase
MQEGKHPEAKYTLRLKIDCEHPNPTLRDPVIYRVLYQPHPRSGYKWKVYPMYDFAHCICDSLENITHSLCTLEFEIRRELYYWILTNLNLYKPFVYEFSRLNVSNNMLSKRKIAKLIEMGIVSGWDDPRLLTLAGLRRRGYTA